MAQNLTVRSELLAGIKGLFIITRDYIPNAIEHAIEAGRIRRENLLIEIDLMTNDKVWFWVQST